MGRPDPGQRVAVAGANEHLLMGISRDRDRVNEHFPREGSRDAGQDGMRVRCGPIGVSVAVERHLEADRAAAVPRVAGVMVVVGQMRGHRPSGGGRRRQGGQRADGQGSLQGMAHCE